MRTGFVLELRLARIQNANELLEWMKKGKKTSGRNVEDDIIDPFSMNTLLSKIEIWRAWDILKQSGRCQSRSCWEWQILSRKRLYAEKDGSIKPLKE